MSTVPQSMDTGRTGLQRALERPMADDGSSLAAQAYQGPNSEYSRYINTGTLRWHVQIAGSGPVMLLLHGTGSTTHTWRHLLPLLTESFTVVAPDLPGHGQSSRPTGELSLPAMSGLINELLLHLDMHPEFAVGHSAGAAIALNLAMEQLINPRRVIGINAALLPFGGVLTHAFAPLARILSSVPLLSRQLAAKARKPGSVERLLAGTGSHLDAGQVDDYRYWLGQEQHVAATLAMMAGWDLNPLLQRLTELNTPLSLIVGEADNTVSPEEARKVQSKTQLVEVIRLAGLGHLAHEEAADKIAGVIMDKALRPNQAAAATAGHGASGS